MVLGIIYKITNKVNNKVYIGQTIRPMQERFNRHMYDALKNPNPTIYFQRAIKKYGKENFYIEQIDSAETKEELDVKEKYWIEKYDSINNGYNTAIGGEGGNTYKGKTTEQLNTIRNKISKSNSGKNNGQSKQIKCKSIITNKEYFFDTLTECLSFLGIKNKGVIMNRVNEKINTLWHHEWMFAFKDKDYQNFIDVEDFDRSTLNGTKVFLQSTTESLVFNSKNKACLFLGLKKGQLVNDSIIKGYHILFSS